jgi:hypothetical protein
MGPFIVSVVAAFAAFVAQVLVLPRDLGAAPAVVCEAAAPHQALSPQF